MKFAILVFPGSGCDVDMHHAIKEVLGEEAEYVWHTEAELEDFDAVIIPSGCFLWRLSSSGCTCEKFTSDRKFENICRIR